MDKVKSVIELSRYKPGQIAYRVLLVAVDNENYCKLYSYTIGEDVRSAARKLGRNTGRQLPHLALKDYHIITELLSSRFEVIEYEIATVYKCDRTGHFFYRDIKGNEMPESYLFDTATAARREKSRILKMMKDWADG